MYGSGAAESDEPDSKSGSEPEPAAKRIKLRLFGRGGELLGYADEMDPEERLPFENEGARAGGPSAGRLEDLVDHRASDLLCPEMDLWELGRVDSPVSTNVAA